MNWPIIHGMLLLSILIASGWLCAALEGYKEDLNIQASIDQIRKCAEKDNVSPF